MEFSSFMKTYGLLLIVNVTKIFTTFYSDKIKTIYESFIDTSRRVHWIKKDERERA